MLTPRPLFEFPLTEEDYEIETDDEEEIEDEEDEEYNAWYDWEED